MTDGNTYAINKHLAEREAYDAAHPPDYYCAACDETLSPLDWPEFINDKEAECPNCRGALEET